MVERDRSQEGAGWKGVGAGRDGSRIGVGGRDRRKKGLSGRG